MVESPESLQGQKKALGKNTFPTQVPSLPLVYEEGWVGVLCWTANGRGK